MFPTFRARAALERSTGAVFRQTLRRAYGDFDKTAVQKGYGYIEFNPRASGSVAQGAKIWVHLPILLHGTGIPSFVGCVSAYAWRVRDHRRRFAYAPMPTASCRRCRAHCFAPRPLLVTPRHEVG